MSVDFKREVLRLAELRQQELTLKRKYAVELAEVKAATANANAFEKTLREAAKNEFDARLELGLVEQDQNVDLTPELRIQWHDVTEYSLEENIIAAIANAPQLVSIDEAEIKRLVKQGKADWAIPSVTREPYTVLSERLGDILIREELENARVIEPESF